MLYSQLLIPMEKLNNQQLSAIDRYLNSISDNTIITVSKFAMITSLDVSLATQALKILVDNGIVIFHFAVRCPECNLLLKTIDSPVDLDDEIFCYNCEENIQITTDDIEVFYKLTTSPFVTGQQNEDSEELVMSAVQYDDSLTRLLEEKLYDFNKLYFCPSDTEYFNLKIKYERIFDTKLKAKAKGDSLEGLIIQLFNHCKHFCAAGIRLRPNQIDCYVRNKLFIPGIAASECTDSFIIECKNEKSTPKVEYLNKIHSILSLHGKRFGIIISKSSAPRTFNNLSHNIFLLDKYIIISLDNKDLYEIIINKNNLLESLERKIDEVKLNATTDLITAGLYES